VNQSTTATLRGFLAIRCASCVPDFESNPPANVLFDLLVRTLLSNGHIDVSDLKISDLTQITSGRPVTVPSTFPAFPEAPVRSPSVPSRTFESRTSENDRCRIGVSLSIRGLLQFSKEAGSCHFPVGITA
jgi:hypothetical protein